MIKKELTKQIIGCFYDVYNALRWGFLEKVYENALSIELEESGLSIETQVPISVHYKSRVVGDYFADMLVAGDIIIELKAVEKLTKPHEAQLLNYLKSTDKEIGLLLNFGPEPQIVRKIFTNDRMGKKN
ncbi:MAG: GxxExxY protein [Candidatus Marinimicrobia bacterium]|nr:GxxExxY protein [Candidatus Neomarinimicrobiota bacterium]MCF7903066.1 GxxExxY protein [Candidatus Neomarinimicrobiota bacterium]